MGMPSPLTRLTSPGLVILDWDTVTVWSSRWSTERLKPRRASLREMTMSMWRSLPLRWKRGWGFCFRVMTTSPGIWPGICSDMRGNLISAPASMPCSTRAFKVVSSSLHFSLDGTSSCCWTSMPGLISRCTVLTSFGQRPHDAHLPSVLPAHFRQTMRREICAATSLPRYMSSSDTASSTRASGPRLPPPRCRPPPPPPNSIEKGSMPPPGPSSTPSLTDSNPPVSYSIRFSSSPRTSYARLTRFIIFSHDMVSTSDDAFSISTSPLHLSGWYLSESFRYDFLMSFASHSSSRPSTSYRSKSSSLSSFDTNVAWHFSPSCTLFPFSFVSAAASIFVGRILCKPASPHRMYT
mmetsp:Transcript_22630/g.69585  ORF Transcript_22630/g.69585 Transcript_22630/m.69585 type:complete len:351 (-) Transcript_22630:214-1266(-)